MLLEGRSSDLCSMPWGVRGSLVSWANCSVGIIQFCPTPPGRPAVCPDPTRRWYVRVLDPTSVATQEVFVFVAHIELEFAPKEEDDRSSMAKNHLETLHFGPSKHDHLFEAQRKPKTVSRENNGSIPLPSGSNSNWFPDMPCMKRVYRDKIASFHWSAARNKERFSSR